MLSGFSLFLFTVGCDKQERTGDVAQGKYDMVVSLTDKLLADYQNKLLDVAFEAASAIPIQPHIKDRSRAQGKVVETSLELDQPLRALRYIEKIDNWRRGTGYGALAFFYARHGYANETQQYSDLALQFSESAEDWHKDHIRMKIANAYALLGETQQADQYVKDLADVESLKVAKVTAMIANDDHFNEQMKALDALLVSSNFDIVENALKVCTNLFNRFYDNTERRSFVEEKIKTSW
ncbi:MAG: hypothetical protein QG591_2184, partial [Planctomycetota bacterium]|nr:hypothetical protein [Planctomycetota bacterium]